MADFLPSKPKNVSENYRTSLNQQAVCTKGSHFPYILLTAQEVWLFTYYPDNTPSACAPLLDCISKNKSALYFSMKSHIHYAWRYICVQHATPKVNKGHKEKLNRDLTHKYLIYISNQESSITYMYIKLLVVMFPVVLSTNF